MTSASISLEITNKFKDCDEGYIEIRCVVKGELVADIFSISLKRLDKEVAYVSYDIALEDTELANRSGVLVSSLIRDDGLSYLSIRIMGSVVKPLKDKGPYQCLLIGIDKKFGSLIERSTLEMLNITGNTKILCYMYVLVHKIQAETE